MKWFFGFDERAAHWFSDMVRVAVISARANTSLEPHCLYDGKPNDLTRWLLDHDVRVHRTRVPFRKHLFAPSTMMMNQNSHYRPEHAAGAFLRLHAHRFAGEQPFLYTDCDIMFLDDAISQETTARISAVPELGYGDRFNSGVMVIAPRYVSKRMKALEQFIADRNYYAREHGSYDQYFLNGFFTDLWAPLSPQFNWRPVKGINHEASIVHFHGPKPHRISAILAGEERPEEEGHAKIIGYNREGYKHYLNLFEAYLRQASPMQPLPRPAPPNAANLAPAAGS